MSMYKNNISIQKIAAVLDIQQLEVYETLEELRIPRINDKNIERDHKICNMYENNIKITNIAKKLHINRHTVTNILQKYGKYNESRNLSYNDPIKIERNNNIVKTYLSGLSISQTAQKLKLGKSLVSKVLYRLNIPTRPQHMKGHSLGTTRNRKYHFDLNFFEKIDTEEKAYWFGFLCADGYVARRGVVQIELKESDKIHLEKFRDTLGDKNIAIKYNVKTKSYGISLCSVKMADDLTKLGCIQKKSLKLTFPTEDMVPSNLIHHFMRGYFDGDGCIYISKTQKSNMFSVLGTKDFLNGFEQHLLAGIGRDKPNKRIHRKEWAEDTEMISYGGNNQLKRIYNFLYKNSTIYLERKKDKFIELFSRSEPKSQKTQNDENGIKLEGCKAQ